MTVLFRPDGRAIVPFASPGRIVTAASASSPNRFTMLSYRQTEKPAAKGGKANSNFFRFRHKAMRAIARSFRNAPFISGHDWNDVRARGGKITDAWAGEPDGNKDELGIFATVKLTAEWAKAGVDDGTIDRFSIGAQGEGEIRCTIHDAPVWTECYCWRGLEVDGKICEWEFEDAKGVEISAVNVPAVEGTGIIDIAASRHQLDPATAEVLARLCGRPRLVEREMVQVTAPIVAAPPVIGPVLAAPVERDAHRWQAICATLGLSVTATDVDVDAAIATQQADRARMERELADAATLDVQRVAELTAAHVDAELARLRTGRQVFDPLIAQLRATSLGPNGRAMFDASLALVEAAAPQMVAIVGGRPLLQSDSRPALEAGEIAEEPDAYELNKYNPHLSFFMKAAGITAEDVRKHGSRTYNQLPNLAELAQATFDRRDR